jgi:predicted Zn-dependent peptidase
VEQVLLGVLSGGMSGRLFTEVREKQGLVYWVGAWHEQPRGKGIVHLGASTTPDRCDRTLETLQRELRRLGEDLTEAEVNRARDSLLAHAETEDDLTRARAGRLSDDLFHFGHPIGPEAKLDAIRAVNLERVAAYARRLPVDRVCVGTLGPREL